MYDRVIDLHDDGDDDEGGGDDGGDDDEGVLDGLGFEHVDDGWKVVDDER